MPRTVHVTYGPAKCNAAHARVHARPRRLCRGTRCTAHKATRAHAQYDGRGQRANHRADGTVPWGPSDKVRSALPAATTSEQTRRCRYHSVLAASDHAEPLKFHTPFARANVVFAAPDCAGRQRARQPCAFAPTAEPCAVARRRNTKHTGRAHDVYALDDKSRNAFRVSLRYKRVQQASAKTHKGDAPGPRRQPCRYAR